MIHYTPDSFRGNPDLLEGTELSDAWDKEGAPPNKRPEDWLYTNDARAVFDSYVKAYVRFNVSIVEEVMSDISGEPVKAPPPEMSDERIQADPVKAAFVLGLIQCEDTECFSSYAIASEYVRWMRQAL